MLITFRAAIVTAVRIGIIGAFGFIDRILAVGKLAQIYPVGDLRQMVTGVIVDLVITIILIFVDIVRFHIFLFYTQK